MVNENNLISQQEEAEEIRTDTPDDTVSAQTNDEPMDFGELYEQSLQNVQFGEIVTGKIVQITNDVVMVDVGWKTEGHIPTKELKDADGNISLNVGDEIEILVDRRDGEGNLILSRDKAAKLKVWDDIKQACSQNALIEGVVVERVKGGLSVDIGIPAFLPGSQVDIRPVRDLDKYVGQSLTFNILKYDRKRNNVVLSRRAILEAERESEKIKTLENLEEGKIVEGIIKNITDYGIFIDLGGVDGLLHVTDMSWGRMTRPSGAFARGDKITVKVLSFDRERERVSLGLKQLMENPWDTILSRYPIGSIVTGKVVNLTDYGVFVELEPGVEGLIHISEMFWTREIKHPSKVLSLGEEVNIMILDINPDLKRISLGLKQTMTNPWEALKEKYPEGSVLQGVIRNITNFGIFVGVEESIDGLIHVSDISWRHRVVHPSEMYKKGQTIEAVVLHIDPENEKFSLGIKQLETDPWETLEKSYPVGSSINGKITNITDFGMFVEIEEGIEGLIHVSELSQKRIKSASELHNVGDAVTATVKNIDAKNRKIRLTLRDSEAPPETYHGNQYLNNKENLVSPLGEALADVKIGETEPSE
ncbi:MAG: 30S ribosomal protein S1 [Syntrophales bacterium]|jgi:small subunit ribosomal protein S1|nr:30S ribosomal protein S1 [Syntrophales bacterium]